MGSVYQPVCTSTGTGPVRQSTFFYGPRLVGSPCLKVVYATQNVVRARVTCHAIRESTLTGPVNSPGASCRGSHVL